MTRVELLLAAARTNNSERIRQIIESGVSINSFGPIIPEDNAKLETDIMKVEDLHELTALHLACLYGHFEAVKTCIALGANVNIESRISPICCAVIGGGIEILNCLAEHGADFLKPVGFTLKARPFSTVPPKKQNLKYDSLSDLLKTIQKHDCDISDFIKQNTLNKDEKGSCLYYALANGHLQQIKQLLAAKVIVKEKHYYAAGLSHQLKHTTSEIYDLLPKSQAPIPEENKQEAKDDAQLKNLIDKIKNNKITYLNSSIKNLSEIVAQDERGSCLYFALINNNKSAVSDLLKAGALVKNKHFYAAGMAKNNKVFFEILKDSVISREPNFKSDNAYEILGISQYASKKQIKAAYVSAIKFFHPDKHGDNNEIAVKINNAYESLTKNNSFYSSSFGFYDDNKTSAKDDYSPSSYHYSPKF